MCADNEHSLRHPSARYSLQSRGDCGARLSAWDWANTSYHYHAYFHPIHTTTQSCSVFHLLQPTLYWLQPPRATCIYYQVLHAYSTQRRDRGSTWLPQYAHAVCLPNQTQKDDVARPLCQPWCILGERCSFTIQIGHVGYTTFLGSRLLFRTGGTKRSLCLSTW